MKPGQDETAKRGRRWKRALLLAPVLAGLFAVAVVEAGHPANGKAGGTKGGLFAALADPLSLFAERSPGGRGAGPLLSTKPGLAPEERVLSEVRERDPGPGIAPGIDPVFGVAPDGLAPGGDPPAGDPGGGPGGGDPFGGGGPGPFAAFNPGQPEFLPFAPGSPPRLRHSGGSGARDLGDADPGILRRRRGGAPAATAAAALRRAGFLICPAS